ncbi:MAG TPA: RNA polymerase sigma factor [Bacteroidales bacterium]|nr:RNA polymerase sigma factor [Bacteroidales bacterium]
MTAIEFQHKLVGLEGSLERFAYSLTLNREDAKDLLQETFLKALTYKDKFVQNDNFKAWTYTIMKNTFINNYRRNIRQNTHRDNTKEGYFLNHMSVTGNDDPDSSYSTEELTKTINELEDEFRIPFQMHHDGYKYKEIADELNLNIGTVKSRIFFSRKKLTEKLKDFAA